VAVSAFTSYISEYPEEIERATSFMHEAVDPVVKRLLAVSLAGRLPFLLVSGQDPRRCRPIVESMIETGKSAGLVAFLNFNRDSGIEDAVLGWIAPYLETDAAFRKTCASYLDPRLRAELGIAPEEAPRSSRKIPLTRADRIGLWTILALIVILPAAAVAAGLSGATIGRTWILAREVFRQFTYWFGFYAITLNGIYLLLILLARKNLNSQAEYWKLLDKEYLFTNGILPSISVLAPAYNEEKTVVQSVHSLLSLEYPNFQVIVINDGSADTTMEVLSQEFELERIDPTTRSALATAPVRSVYRSPRYTKLLVIDKDNGGKADALNAGINLAASDYVCSIDSDSLLEPDALLRMTAQILTSDTETIAVGGNILPVNGCAVERGMLQHIALAHNKYARLQTIEYLRSFIAGRLGWSQLNALLIISGAFGLFRRDRVLEIGGYMTGRGEFNRDTVGEDMELVVRLIRRMCDTRRKYRIRYASSANCWTEVPEDLNSLYKQRDRWHRGLVEIMTWHRKMIFNPRYGTAGLVAFPYFLIFEFIGPFYEFAGYPLLLVGFATGALHWHIFAIMFSAVLLFGLLISIVSLALSERGIVYFRREEQATLLGYSVIENFGFRQLMGWVRVFSFVGMLLKNKGWQKLERKGFTAKPQGSVGKT
ncbi:MAG: glycosyltransferase family 2 protein, partial [Spirochaetales bacterium]